MHILRFYISGATWLFTTLLGRLEWQAPAWLTWVGSRCARAWRYVIARPARAVTLALMLVAAGALGIWYARRPEPHYVTVTIEAPQLTEYRDNGTRAIKPMTVLFSEPAAPLAQIQKMVTTGITLSPAIAGTWFWVTDRDLQFAPKDDWPVDGAFDVKLARKGLVRGGALLDQYTFTFRSQAFAASVSESKFYQDPVDPSLKKLVATVTFSHPVDTGQLERRVSLAAAKDAEYLGLSSDSRHFTVTYDKFKLSAYIHSAALAMPRDDTSMTLTIGKGVRAARGGNGTPRPLQAVVVIPGRASLRFSDARMAVVDNARYEPEQILLLASSSPVAESALARAVEVRLLPVRSPRQPKEDKEPYRWNDPEEIGTDILGTSTPVRVSYVASDEAGNASHGFKFTAPVGRYLHVVVKDGVQGTGGYVSGKPYVATVQVEPYPQALTFLGQGSLLSLSGDRRVGFLSRDIDKVEIEIGRVLPNQLHHLVPRMWNFSRPALYGMEDTLVERFSAPRDYSGRPPGKPTYDSIDLGQYLQDRTQSRRGLFLLRIRATNARRGDPGASDEDDGGRYRRGSRRLDDARLVLVTDLGFIVKQARDGSRDVFVQSIRTGAPVEGARVEIVGSNGQPVLAATTDAGGKAVLPPSDNREFRREKTPTLVLVQKDADVSFMPLRSSDRGLDLSRFDTGGVQNATSAQQLSAYLFSDRGIYRPGETTHLGVITRTADWAGSLTGLPLDVEITDPRGMVVSRSQMKLSAASFDEVTFTSQPAAPTGTYQAVAYLAKDPTRRETLGSTSFRLQEFEPDRLKVRLDLADAPVDGWLKTSDVKARVAVVHLFGEAAGNRRVEGDLGLSPVLPKFTRYPDYRFQIGESLTEPQQEPLAPTVTDNNGKAELQLDLKRFVGRAYQLSVLVRAFEAEGGRNVAAQASAIVSDAPYLVGVKPDGDLTFVPRAAPRAARWMAVNQQLAPVAAGDLTLEWVQRRFVSVLTKQPDGTLAYVSRLKETVRDSRRVSVAVGGSRFPLPTQEPGDFVMVLRHATGAELNRLNYSVAGQANVSRSLERNTELQIQLDKPAYSGGDSIAVSIRAPYIGAGLITVERDRVFCHQWFRTTTTSSVQRIALPADFAGNGYVSVQFLRDPGSEEIFMSPLSYGVAPFSPNLAARAQAMTIAAPAQVRPGAVLTMRLTPGERSRVALLAVDEGILQVARYRNPDPLAFFFQKRMLEVNTTQILDLILPEFRQLLALAAPGGDADGGFARHLNPFTRKRKPPVAYWSGVIDVGPEGRELRYAVPDFFNGRLRIVAIGASAGRVGVAEAGTEVKGDFVLTPNLPAMVAPGDEFLVSVGVFNNTTGATGPIRLEAQLGGGLSLAGPAAVDLPIADKAEGVGEFRIKANAPLGPASLRFIARRGAAEARIEESVSVRPAVAYRTQLALGRAEGASAEVLLTRSLYGEQRTVEAAVSTLPIVWGQGLTAYLDSYPYTCTEQLVSKGLSALIITARPEFGVVRSPDARPLDSTFSVLRSRSNDSGGFGLWSSSPQTAEFPTVYAAHFLVEARERGQSIPTEVLTAVDNWLTRFSSTPASSLADGRLRAYAVYLLVRQGIKPNAVISNVEQELTKRYAETWTTDLAAAYLASTYRLMQRNDDADRIIRNVPWSSQRRNVVEETYYDPVVHDAQLLYLLSRHFPGRLGSTPPVVLETISAAVSGNRASSLSAAYTMLALDAFAKPAAGDTTLAIAEVDRDGRQRALPMPSGTMPKVSLSEAASKVRFSRQGPAIVYYVVAESGFDRSAPVNEIAQGIEVFRDFLDVKLNPLTRATVGQEFFVRLRLRTKDRDSLAQVAVVDLLPGGVEPVIELQPVADTSEAGADPARLRGGAAFAFPIGVPGQSDWTPSHVDVRDDRVVLYGDATKSTGTFVYRVRATNAGVFQVPPAFAEGMYNRTVTGLSLGTKLEIVKP